MRPLESSHDGLLGWLCPGGTAKADPDGEGDMLHRVKELRHYSIGALDGHIGRIRDAYFDDQGWTIRYLVVDTAHWLAGRRVLISPLSLRGIDPVGKTLPASLTRAQVANSPDFDTEKPVSRQHECELYQYYGLPYSWMADEDQLPLVEIGMAAATAQASASEGAGSEEDEDPHLRSAQAVTQYQVHARDANIGHVSDFLFDDTSWTIGHVVVATGSWWPGRSVLVPVGWVEQVNWAASRVEVRLPGEAIKQAPEYDTSRPLSADYLARLAAYYGVRPGSSEERDHGPSARHVRHGRRTGR